jgi:hypothetical protein
MERKNMGKKAAIRPKVKKGKGKTVSKASASKKGVAKVDEARRYHVSPCPSDEYDEDLVEFLKTYKPRDGYSSSSDEIDSDYAEFLKTYVPEEDAYPGGVSSDEVEDSGIFVDTQGKTGPSPSSSHEKP